MKLLKLLFIIPFLFIVTMVYAVTPMYSTETDQGMAKMFNKSGLVDGIYWSGGQITRFSDIGAGVSSFSGLTGSATASQLPPLSGLNGSVTASQIPEIDLTVATATAGITSQQVPYGSSSGQLNSEAGFTYDPVTNTLTVPAITATNVTVTGTLESGSQYSTAGSSSVTTGIGYDQTHNINGTTAAWVGTGSGKFDVSGLQGGANLGSTTLQYSSLLNSARKRPFAFTEFLGQNAGNMSVDPFMGIAITSGALNNPTSGGVFTSPNHPGVIKLTGSSSANSGYCIRSATNSILIGGGEHFECIFNLNLATTTTYMGFHDSATVAEPVDGAYMALYGSSTIQGMTSNNSTRGTTSTKYTLGTSTWYRASVVVGSSATRVDYTLYNDSGTVLWTDNLTTNIPTGAGRECTVNLTTTEASGGSLDLMHLDFLAFAMDKDLVR